MIGAKGAHLVGGDAHHAGGHPVEYAFPLRPRSDIDRVLEAGRNRPVIFRRQEQNGVPAFDLRAKTRPGGRRVVIEVFIIKRQIADLDDRAIERVGRHGDERMGDLSRQRTLAQASHQNGNL